MRSNPFRLTLAILGIGLVAIGAFLWLIAGALPVDPDTGMGNGPVVDVIGRTLMGIGWVPLVGWLVVRGIQYVPGPPKERDGKSEEEIRAYLEEQRKPIGPAS